MTLESHGATVNPGLEILGLEFFICGQTDLSSPKHISVFSCINNNGKLTKGGGRVVGNLHCNISEQWNWYLQIPPGL